MTIEVSVVVPVFNSPGTLRELVKRISIVLQSRCGESYEVILVDDGSDAESHRSELGELKVGHEFLRIILLTRNFGQQAATMAGLGLSRGKKVVTMDDDLQHAPEDIPLLLEMSGHDVVIGHLVHKTHTFLRRVASRIKGWFDRIVVGKPRGLQLSSFRVMDRVIVDAVCQMQTSRPFLPALLFHVTKDVVGVPVRHTSSPEGVSRYSYSKLVRLFLDLVIHNSSLVLRLVGHTGLLLSGLSVFTAGVVVVRKVFYQIAVQGWASLFVAVLFIGGLLLLCMGILGEYLVRIVEENEARPCYVIREELGYSEYEDTKEEVNL